MAKSEINEENMWDVINALPRENEATEAAETEGDGAQEAAGIRNLFAAWADEGAPAETTEEDEQESARRYKENGGWKTRRYNNQLGEI